MGLCKLIFWTQVRSPLKVLGAQGDPFDRLRDVLECILSDVP